MQHGNHFYKKTVYESKQVSHDIIPKQHVSANSISLSDFPDGRGPGCLAPPAPIIMCSDALQMYLSQHAKRFVIVVVS